MGYVVLALGALMVVAGAYEMVSGNGDILSERGWSAFIAGAVLVGSGAVTAALGLTLQAVDRLRVGFGHALVGERAEPAGQVSGQVLRQVSDESAQAPLDLAREPASNSAFGLVAVAPAAAAGVALAEVSHAREVQHPASLPFEPGAELDPQLLPMDLQAVRHHPAEEHAGERLAEDPPIQAEAGHADWLDHSFADLEREITEHHSTPPLAEASEPTTVDTFHQPNAVSEERSPDVTDVATAAHDPWSAAAVEDQHLHDETAPEQGGETISTEPRSEVAQHEEPALGLPHGAHADHEPQPAAPEGAVVAAREALAPASSQVIGRYEAEGTSYVMYADGSIDAQSDAGVYRFASMAELKTFIES